MREAKERKRLSCSDGNVVSEIGKVVFSGPLFGSHVVRLMARSDVDAVYLEVDGRVTCAKTQRGVRAVLMRRVARGLEGGHDRE